jgi:TetR/AcrR family transcriptional regulator, acrAB operon repressor
MTATAPSKKARQSGRTREALLSECLLLAAQRGFSRTSIDDIAQAAGVTKGAMYWHFASKDELFHAMLERIRELWQQVVHLPVSARQSPAQRLAQLFESYAELFRGSPEICLFLQQVLLDRHHKKYSAQVAKVFEKTARFIAAIIDEGKAAGEVRKDVDSMTVAHVILGMLAGASQQASTARAQPLQRLLSEARAMTLAYLTPAGVRIASR